MYRLSDFCIGDFPVSEYFGADPATYNARYGIQGYPGIRIKMPTLTPILASAAGFVLETGMEEAGKGKYITLVHEGYLTSYGHLNDILVQKGEKVIEGQLIAHSNQSGLTDYPCLYFGVAPCDAAGNKTSENGYGGFIDPMGDGVEWDIKNLKEPITKADVAQNMTTTSDEYSILSAQATNYRIILNFLKAQTNFDEYLKEQGRPPINLQADPKDPEGGHAAVLYLSAVADDVEQMNEEMQQLQHELGEQKTPEQIAAETELKSPIAKKPTIFVKLKHAIGRFVFKPKNSI